MHSAIIVFMELGSCTIMHNVLQTDAFKPQTTKLPVRAGNVPITVQLVTIETMHQEEYITYTVKSIESEHQICNLYKLYI